MDSRLHILQESVEVFAEAAKFFITSNTAYATRSRRKANRSAQGKPGKHAFHPAILSSLSLLLSLLRDDTKSVDYSNVELCESVDETLDVFERLVGEYDKKRSYPASYRGLRELRAQYDADAYEQRRPKPPGFRRHLYCPAPDFQVLLKSTIEHCCRAIVLATIPAERLNDITSILAETRTVREWELPPALATHPEALHTVLSKYEACSSSNERGDVRVAFSAARRRSEALGTYQLRLSCPVHAFASWRPATLHLFPSEQTSGTTYLGGTRAGRRAVRFQGSEEPEQDEINLRSVCQACHNTTENVHILARSEGLKSQQVSGVGGQSAQPQNPTEMTTLRVALDNQTFSAVRDKERIILAVIVSYLYLCLGDTLWWEFRPDFWFTFGRNLSVRQPFLRFRSDASAVTKPSYPEKGMNSERASLPALGKLLLEIWRGKSVSWDDLDRTLEECRNDVTGEYWLCAINACLGESADLKHPGAFRESQALRATYVHRVIKSLQWLLEKVCRLSVDDVFRDLTPVDEGRQRSNAPIPQSRDRAGAASSPTASPNGLCLHDDSDEWETVDKKAEQAAIAWETDLEQMVHKLCSAPLNRGPSSPAPIRIAILDTGISLNAIAQRTYKTRIKSFRSWVNASSVVEGDERPLSDDSDGHGTHAASVLLRMDPACDLYVAKVFEGRKASSKAQTRRQTQQAVANALHYAIHAWKVNVISLSFGYEESIDEIDDEILNAVRKKILVLAAASNYGANKDQSWPARHPNVMCVYAADGYGNKYPRNPTAPDNDDKFATLGVEVKAWWKPGQKAHRSGTSTSTPVAAGIASLVLGYMRQSKAEYLGQKGVNMSWERYDELVQRLSTYACMRRVFMKMTGRERDGYQPIEPWRLLNPDRMTVSIVDDILQAIRTA